MTVIFGLGYESWCHKYDGSAFRRYTTADGLLDDSIHANRHWINIDVWCGTDYGVNILTGKPWAGQ